MLALESDRIPSHCTRYERGSRDSGISQCSSDEQSAYLKGDEMDKLFDLLFQHGGLIQLVVFIVPGFVAWRTYQWRRPQGEQKAADAIVDIITFSALTSLIWYKSDWSSWPKTTGGALSLTLEIFVTPVLIALAYQYVVEFSAARNWITSPHPRAWDFIFNALAHRKTGVGQNGLFLVVTLKNGDKVAGVFSEPGFASLWPYDRDLLLGPTWELTDGMPARLVAGSIGLYIDSASIETIEVFDYAAVVHSVASTGG